MQMVERIFEKFAIITAAAIGIYMLAVSMRLGPGVGGDAVIYITSAKNLLAGNGLGLVNPAGDFRLLPYFPPFYPLFLAFFGLLGFSIAKIAGILDIVLFALTIILIGLWIKRTTKNIVASFLGSLLLACSPILIPAYSWAMSEPLCIRIPNTRSSWRCCVSRFLASWRKWGIWGFMTASFPSRNTDAPARRRSRSRCEDRFARRMSCSWRHTVS